LTKRRRAERRAADREAAKARRDIERAVSISPGGTPARAIEITSPSEVEVAAQGMPCIFCRASVRVEEHTAETVAGVRVRVAKVVCSMCRGKRDVFFKLPEATLN
jgi:hypothetical protein